MKPENPRCPSCQRAAIDVLGPISSSIYFAGQRLPSPIEGGRLHWCRSCHLHFRHPRLAKDESDDLYNRTPAGSWQYSLASRADWRIARNWIDQYIEQGRLLDVGCFDGGFLSLVGEGFERFGLEINPEAAERARAKNIEILGADFADLGKLSEAFDAIIAMDVIEHVENPKALLESMANALRGGGLLMVSTGNTESWTWRMMGSRYWYCTVSEHISFINPSWCWHVAPATGLEIVGIERFAHQGDAPLSQRIAELGKNLFYRLFPRTAAWLRTKGYGGVDISIDKSTASTPPMWLSAPDHFIVLFRKP